ncbi:MAG: antibiotic biosynthesis monooxygenase [bacterium]|nr:antibiotic biosynthesis monooxygenase [bacterium]
MIATIVYVHVKKEYVDDFVKATVKNHEASIIENGNMRFDFLQDENDPCKFVLYEAYESKEKAAEHKKTEHYSVWRTSVENYMTEKRKGVPYKGIKP